MTNEFQKGNVNWKAIENSHKPEVIEKKRQKMIGKKPWNFGNKMAKEYCEKCRVRANNGFIPKPIVTREAVEQEEKDTEKVAITVAEPAKPIINSNENRNNGSPAAPR